MLTGPHILPSIAMKSSNIIFIASGQCGNQVSHEILNNIYQHMPISHENHEIFFNKSKNSINMKTFARLACFDTEPKVIQDCIMNSKRNGLYSIDSRAVAYRHGGAGNNWALGYSMCRYSEKLS